MMRNMLRTSSCTPIMVSRFADCSAASAVTRESCLVLSVLSSSQCSPPPSHHNLLLHRNLCLCPVFSAAHQLTSSCHQNTRHHQLTIITIS